MNWDDLRFFLAVARSGQLARAGAQLGVDATTVGRRLRRLETELQQTLFELNRHGHALTEAGERLLLEAEGIERAANTIASRPASLGQVAGLIRVSVSEGFGTWLLASRLRDFARAHPEVRVDLVANSGFLNPSRREADVAILLARPSRGPLVSRKLSDYRIGFYASPDYLAEAGAADIARDELGRHRLIGYIPDLIYAPELRYLDEVADGLVPELRSSSINAQYRLAASGAGVAALPRFIGDADPDLRRIAREVEITRTFWLVTHEDTRRLARIEAFTTWLLALIRAQGSRLLG